MITLIKLMYLLLSLWALAVGAIFVASFATMKGAPQEAAAAGMACAAVVIPYVFIRAMEKIAAARMDEIGDYTNRLLKRLADRLAPTDAA